MSQALPAEPKERGSRLTLTITIPSWLLSVAIHAALLVAFGVLVQPPKAAGVAEVEREVGVVLRNVDDQGKASYEGDKNSLQPSAPTPGAKAVAATDLVGDRPPIDLSDALPKQRDLIGIAGNDPGLPRGASGLIPATAQARNFGAGYARTKVYGIAGEGFKFVYVFDRSASMGGGGNNALGAAKAELLQSLAQLGPTHQFQIIFYNDEPKIFALSGQGGQLVFGTDLNKRQAELFVKGIQAGGGTRHAEALELALALKPDVIYFLTDADQPSLSGSEMARIRRKSSGAVINAIEFGSGPRLGDDNFLMQLARENRGSYVYLDIAKALQGK